MAKEFAYQATLDILESQVKDNLGMMEVFANESEDFANEGKADRAKAANLLAQAFLEASNVFGKWRKIVKRDIDYHKWKEETGK